VKARDANEIEQDPLLDEALAALIAGTFNKKRPSSLVDMLAWLEIAETRLGSLKAVADRVGISTKMLSQFKSVAKLSSKVKALFASRKIDSVDAAVHISSLPVPDQVVVANKLSHSEIDTSDVRAILQVRKHNLKMPISTVVECIQKTKTKKHYVVEFAIRGEKTKAELESLLKQSFNSSDIVALEIQGSLGRLILTQSGKRQLGALAKEHSIPIKNVISRLLK